MELFRVLGKRLVHKAVELPPIENAYISRTGRKGPACGADFGLLYPVEEFDGKKKDITCPECRYLS